MASYNDPYLLEPKTQLNTFVTLQTITRNVGVNSAAGTFAAEEFLNTTNRVSDGTLLSGWGITGLTTWGVPPMGNITHLRINGNIFRISTIGAFNFYGWFTDAFDNKIDSPYPTNTPITSFETGYISVVPDPINPLPPTAMTANTVTLADGSYTATLSTQFSGTPIGAFDKNYTSGFTTQVGYDATTGASTNTFTTNGVGGEWIQLQIPVTRLVQRYDVSILFANATTRAPTSLVLFGSSNGVTWTQMDNRTGLTWSSTALEIKTFTCQTPLSCTFLRLVAPTIVPNGQGRLLLGEVVYYY
jgi:hypothetical protein